MHNPAFIFLGLVKPQYEPSRRTKREYVLCRNGREPQARDRDYGRNSGCPEALSIGNYEAVSDPAFDHRGCRDLRRADHAAD